MSEHQLSVNQFMAPSLPLERLTAVCKAAGGTGIGLLRSTIADLTPIRVRRILADSGLVATSSCVVQGLVGETGDERRARMRDARSALDDAAALGVPLVVVPGGPTRHLPIWSARRQFEMAFAELAAHAERLGIAILIEPLGAASVHLSCVTTLRHAVNITRDLPASGIVLDAWHVWTDPDLDNVIERDAGEIRIVHMSDWPSQPTAIFERALPGDGIAGLAHIADHLTAHGFRGWWEVEVPANSLAEAVPDEELVAAGLTAVRALLDRLTPHEFRPPQLREERSCAS